MSTKRDYPGCEAVASRTCALHCCKGAYGVAKHATIHGLRVVDAAGGGTISGGTKAVDGVVDLAERQIYQMSIPSNGNFLVDNAVDLATDQFEVVVVVVACNIAGKLRSDEGFSWCSNTGS